MRGPPSDAEAEAYDDAFYGPWVEPPPSYRTFLPGTPLTCKEQYARNVEIANIRKLSPGLGCQGAVGGIIDLYLLSETIMKKLLLWYNNDGFAINFIHGYPELRWVSIVKMMQYYELVGSGGNQITSTDLGWIFSGGGNAVKGYSVKELRNMYFHALDPGARFEMEKWSAVYLKAMNVFVNLKIDNIKPRCCP